MMSSGPLLSGGVWVLKPSSSSSCNNRSSTRGMKVRCQASSIPADRVPDMEKRNLMNLLLLGALSLPSAGMLVPYATFFAPPGSLHLSFNYYLHLPLPIYIILYAGLIGLHNNNSSWN